MQIWKISILGTCIFTTSHFYSVVSTTVLSGPYAQIIVHKLGNLESPISSPGLYSKSQDQHANSIAQTSHDQRQRILDVGTRDEKIFSFPKYAETAPLYVIF